MYQAGDFFFCFSWDFGSQPPLIYSCGPRPRFRSLPERKRTLCVIICYLFSKISECTESWWCIPEANRIGCSMSITLQQQQHKINLVLLCKKKKTKTVLTLFLPFLVLALSTGVSFKKKCDMFRTCGCLGSQNILSRKKETRSFVGNLVESTWNRPSFIRVNLLSFLFCLHFSYFLFFYININHDFIHLHSGSGALLFITFVVDSVIIQFPEKSNAGLFTPFCLPSFFKDSWWLRNESPGGIFRDLKWLSLSSLASGYRHLGFYMVWQVCLPPKKCVKM